jgi:hypothetical protein
MRICSTKSLWVALCFLVLQIACPLAISQTVPYSTATLSATPVDATVCILAENAPSIGTQALRIRGRIYWLLGELVIRDNGCRYVLEVPFARAARTVKGPDQSVAMAIAHGKSSPEDGHSEGNLQMLLRYVDASVAPIRKDAVCLVCGRYRVSATIVGHLRVRSKSGLGGSAESSMDHQRLAGRSEPGPLIIDSVSNINAVDLYGTLYSPKEYKPLSSS